jgi:hypothetical protein
MTNEVPDKAPEPDEQEQKFADWYIPGGELTDEEREYLDNLDRPDDGPEYHAMIHRTVDGPDPLVQEPKAEE